MFKYLKRSLVARALICLLATLNMSGITSELLYLAGVLSCCCSLKQYPELLGCLVSFLISVYSHQLTKRKLETYPSLEPPFEVLSYANT